MSKKEKIDKILKDEEKLNKSVKEKFDLIDTDHSGEIDTNELENLMLQIARELEAPAPTAEEINQVMKKLDTDKSGKIDLKEFKVFIVDMLKSMGVE